MVGFWGNVPQNITGMISSWCAHRLKLKFQENQAIYKGLKVHYKCMIAFMIQCKNAIIFAHFRCFSNDTQTAPVYWSFLSPTLLVQFLKFLVQAKLSLASMNRTMMSTRWLQVQYYISVSININHPHNHHNRNMTMMMMMTTMAMMMQLFTQSDQKCPNVAKSAQKYA